MTSYYKGLDFRTELLARWAAFFDLAGWAWYSNPASVADWQPDFKVIFPCGHSECPEEHSLLVSVLPVSTVTGITDHPALRHEWGVRDEMENYYADAGAVFGSTPSVSQWVMAHGAGGGFETVSNWVPDAAELWRQAGSLVSTAQSTRA